MRLASILLLAAMLAGCAGDRTAPSCSGPAFALNEGLWTPTEGDLPR